MMQVHVTDTFVPSSVHTCVCTHTCTTYIYIMCSVLCIDRNIEILIPPKLIQGYISKLLKALLCADAILNSIQVESLKKSYSYSVHEIVSFPSTALPLSTTRTSMAFNGGSSLNIRYFKNLPICVVFTSRFVYSFP